MRRALLSLLVVFAMVVSSATLAGAGSFRFRNATFGGGSLVFTGTAVGLGNADYQFDLEGTATVVALCENRGGNQAPGQNPLTASASNTATAMTDQNGQAPVAIIVNDPTLAVFGNEPPSKKEAGCPNGNWSVVGLMVVEWTAAHLVVTDLSNGEVVFDQVFDCSGVDETLQCSEAA